MTASMFRLAYRIQRFEILAATLVVLVVGATALLVASRLTAIGAPVECLAPWMFEDVVYDAARCDPLAQAFLAMNEQDARLVMTTMHVLPLLVGLVLGVGLVGRDIDAGTAPTIWALSGSRRRWLTRRLVPVLVVLGVLLAIAAVTSEILATARVPWQAGRPAFDDAGLHGMGVIARGLAAFGLALVVGAVSGRMLPAILTSALLLLVLWVGGQWLYQSWIEASAHEIEVPHWFNGWYDGGVFTDSGRYRLPDGVLIDDPFVDPATLAPPGVDPATWIEENLTQLAFGVHSPDYPGWMAIEILAFGLLAIGLIGATYVIVERRRPF